MKIQTKRLYKVMKISMFLVFVVFLLKISTNANLSHALTEADAKIFPEAIAVIADLDLWDIIVKQVMILISVLCV